MGANEESQFCDCSRASLGWRLQKPFCREWPLQEIEPEFTDGPRFPGTYCLVWNVLRSRLQLNK